MRFLASLATLVVLAAVSRAADNMKAVPPADAGMSRYVIHPQPQTDENAFQVELLVGKTVKTDAGNRYFFPGTLETETIEGWGFDSSILRTLGPMAGTLMAVDPGAPQVERFITLGGEPRLLRYNSQLPLVVYVSDGVDVRYRIWRADPQATPATQG
jgi:ecotin